MSEYNPAFDMPTTPAQALAWLEKQGDPTCMTFDYRKAAAAARLLGDALASINPALGAVTAELARAVRKFPTWPTDPLHAVAVLGEEFGELTKAVLQSVYEPHKVKLGEVRTEAVQTAAMALRFLQSLDAYAYTPGEQHAQESNEDAAIALMRGQSDTCAWQKDDDEWEGAHWDSACGEKYFFVEGGPSDNGHKFCHGCGKPLHIIEPKDTADEQ